MNMSNANNETAAPVAIDCPVPITDAVKILMVAARLEAKRSEAAELRKEFIAMLPVATSEQFSKVLAAARDELEIPEGYRPNVDFKLSPAQDAELDKVKEARREFCMANKGQLVGPLLKDPTQKLVSLTVRQGKSKVTTTARFEKKLVTSAENRGLLAQLARATAHLQK